MLSGSTLAIGTGALAGYSFLNFTIYPSIAKRMITTPNPYLEAATILATMGLFMGSLTLFDGFNAFGVIPAIMAYGLVWTKIFMKSRSLQIPLWYMRQFSRFTLAAVFMTLLSGYCMVSREFQTSENRSVLANIQYQLDKDMAQNSRKYNQRVMEEEKKREAELQRLKDPFI